MSLSMTIDGDMVIINGIAPGVTTALGRVGYCQQVGPHFVGFDDSFYPPRMNAYFDPTAASTSIRPGTSFVGYIQFMEIRFCGRSVPPVLTNQDMANRMVYQNSSSSSPYVIVDFMSPSQAKTRTIIDPFYALNAMLSGGYSSYQDFADASCPNGSLYFISTPSPLPQTPSACASLSSNVLLDVERPTVEAIQNILAWLHRASCQPIIDEPLTNAQIGPNYAYQLALPLLYGSFGLTSDDILSARQVGPYTLFQIANFEEESPILCVYFTDETPTGKTLKTWVIPYYLYDEMLADNVSSALMALLNYDNEDGRVMFPPAWTPVGGKGGKGLDPNPYIQLPLSASLSIHYTAIAYGKEPQGTRSLYPISGFRYTALRQIDPAGRCLLPIEIGAPVLLTGGELLGSGPSRHGNSYGKALNTFYQLVQQQPPNVAISIEPFIVASLGREDFSMDLSDRGGPRQFTPDL